MSDGLPAEDAPTLYICTACGRTVENAVGDGQRLYDGVSALLQQGTDIPVTLVPVICFANCERGCTAAVSAPGKWSYMMGDLGPEHAADLLTYVQAYANAKMGVVLPSGRPASLQKTVIGRFPSHLVPTKGAAE